MKPSEAKKSSMTLCEPTVGLARRRRNLQLQSVRSSIALDFVVLVLSEAVLSPPRRTVLVLDGFSNFGNADRGSKRFAVTCGPIGRIAILDRFEYEYEKKHEQSNGPQFSIERFSFALSYLLALGRCQTFFGKIYRRLTCQSLTFSP